MSTYSEFLKLLEQVPRAPHQPTPVLSPKESYDQLCYDFPLLNVEDLISFKEEYLESIDAGKYHSFPLRHKFILGINYGASKYNNNNEQNDEANKGYYEQYSTINAIALIKVVRDALRWDYHFIFIFHL